jgi:hypothetical protein
LALSPMSRVGRRFSAGQAHLPDAIATASDCRF